MADTRPTPVSVFRAIWLSLLLLFAPARFAKAEQEDNAARNNFSSAPSREHSSLKVRRAFFASFLLVVVSAAVGYLLGMALGTFVCATTKAIGWLQIAGACVLLWGTLFVRGWEIQTYSGVVLTERVNQWLYRFLYCAGTAALVCSLVWPQC